MLDHLLICLIKATAAAQREVDEPAEALEAGDATCSGVARQAEAHHDALEEEAGQQGATYDYGSEH